jgi:HD-GYP domain-containing protein (c-di-GMP phosphodiesterase class II)
MSMNVGMLEHQERMQATRDPLRETDIALIREHPEAGVQLLRRAGVHDAAWLDCVLFHHENENGTGYPTGKRAGEIPELAKIISLADRYCARVSARSYRKSMVPNHALRDILLEGKTTVDPQLAAVFIRELGVYPIGTFVRLLNGEIGVVTRKGVNTTTPIVDALVGPRGAPLDVIIRRDTQHERHSIREVLTETQAAIGFNLDQLWGRVASV